MNKTSRRNFIRSLAALLFGPMIWPKKAFAQIIPFAFWRPVNPPTNLWVWGVNTYGQLGNGNHTSYSSPVQVSGSWLQVNAAWTPNTTSSTAVAFSLGIKVDGTLWSWGDNVWGELGQNTHTGKFSSPVQIPGSWIQASCGGQGWANPWGMAIRSDHTLWAWGNNAYGMLGQNNITNYSSPVQVLSAQSWTSISCGYAQWLGIQIDGSLWGCGDPGIGELPTGNITTMYSSPVQIPGASWSQVTVMCDNSSGGFGGGIRADGSLWMWGGNGNGDLGVGNAALQFSSPVQIGSSSWTQLSLSSSSSALAIRNDSTLWGWGANGAGQLGQGDLVDRSSPVQIPGTWRSAFMMETATGACAFGLQPNGSLWAWGDNSSGCFGNGNRTSTSSPIQVYSSSWGVINGGQNTGLGLR